MQEYKYCPKCGEEQQAESNFCHKCGFQTKYNVEIKEPTSTENENRYDVIPVFGAKKYSLVPTVIFGLVAQLITNKILLYISVFLLNIKGGLIYEINLFVMNFIILFVGSLVAKHYYFKNDHRVPGLTAALFSILYSLYYNGSALAFHPAQLVWYVIVFFIGYKISTSYDKRLLGKKHNQNSNNIQNNV